MNSDTTAHSLDPMLEAARPAHRPVEWPVVAQHRPGFEAAAVPPEETMVVDDRVGQSPAQAVEARLSRLLGGAMLPVSHLQMRGLLKSR